MVLFSFQLPMEVKLWQVKLNINSGFYHVFYHILYFCALHFPLTELVRGLIFKLNEVDGREVGFGCL